METKYYRYPATIQASKSFCKFAILLAFVLFFVMLTRNKPSDYGTLFDYYATFIWPFILIFASIHYLGSWADIGIDDNGLLVEFLWAYLRVSWKDVVDIKQVGSQDFGVILIRASKGLMFIHRFYSLYTTFSVLPGFHLHPKYISSDLMKAINSYTSRS